MVISRHATYCTFRRMVHTSLRTLCTITSLPHQTPDMTTALDPFNTSTLSYRTSDIRSTKPSRREQPHCLYSSSCLILIDHHASRGDYDSLSANRARRIHSKCQQSSSEERSARLSKSVRRAGQIAPSSQRRCYSPISSGFSSYPFLSITSRLRRSR